jgi:hypothetical protein
MICVTKAGTDYVSDLDSSVSSIRDFYKEHGIHLPTEVISRTVDMWQEIKRNENYITTDKTVEQYMNDINAGCLD